MTGEGGASLHDKIEHRSKIPGHGSGARHVKELTLSLMKPSRDETKDSPPI